MTPSALIDKTQHIYAAFGRGDIAAILAELADDVQWEYDTPNPIPWLQPLRGRDQVPGFFASLAAIEITRFVPYRFFGEGKLVLVMVDIGFTVRATGKQVHEPEELHIWHYDDAGRVARFRHRADTWQHVQALQP